MLKVIITDDHPIVRRGLKQTIADTADILVTDEASNGRELLEKIRQKHFDVVLLDITMPGRGGLDVLKQIKKIKPKLPILMLSMHPEEDYALRAMKTGASGYLTKSSDPSQLILAIRRVTTGRKYVSESLAENLADNINNTNQQERHRKLSNRELEVICKIASGKATSQIAEEMSLSAKTISTYRARILEKMNMKNNAELTHYMIKHNLIT